MKTLLKQNALIRAEAVGKAISGGTIKEERLVHKEYSAKEHDMLNALLYVMQTRLFQKDSLPSLLDEEKKGDQWFTFQLSELKSLAKIKDTSGGAIKEILDSIISKTFRLKQVIAYDEDGKIAKREVISALIKEAEFLAYGKENYVKLQFSRVFVALAHADYSLKYGNYTKLKKQDLDKITEITNKTAKRLFEFINMRNGKIVKLAEEDLRTVCGEQPAFANYKIKIKEAIKKLEPLVQIEIGMWISSGPQKYCELNINK